MGNSKSELQVQFREIIDQSLLRLQQIDDSASKFKKAGNWSAKEIIGHLVDSAINNTVRFTNAPIQDSLIFQGYDQNFWVKINDYQSQDWLKLIQLWNMLNQHILSLLDNLSEDQLLKSYQQHNFNLICWQKPDQDQPVNLYYLIEDYTGHLKHHINQIFNLHPNLKI